MNWISVKDKPPKKDGTEYLGWEKGIVYVFSFRMNDWHECSRSEIAYEVNPTYWMPLPPPPL